jgi:AraC-like DNA-binding protein/effector-binding domain-containing protein
VNNRLNEDVSLEALASRSGWSKFHLHRAFCRLAGETPKQYVQRLRLTRAAATLATSNKTVLEIALAAGFAGHEVFTRAFCRQFGAAPARYRTAARMNLSPDDHARYRALTDAIAPCTGLYHLQLSDTFRRRPMPVISIARQERSPLPVLLIRRRTAREELQTTLGECFGKLYGHAHKAGLAVAGFPLARYVSTGPGLWTVEPAIPLATPAPGEGEMQAGVMPGGPTALGIHGGPYEQLADTHVAIDRWIEANGFRAGGPPWEWYVTDPAQHPDPSTWLTEVYWPLA